MTLCGKAPSVPEPMSSYITIEPEEAIEIYRLLYKVLDGARSTPADPRQSTFMAKLAFNAKKLRRFDGIDVPPHLIAIKLP